MVKIPPLAKSLFVELIQGFYHPRDKDGLRGWYKKPQKKNWNHLWRRNTCMGGTKKSPKRRVGTTYGEEMLAWVVRKSLSGELNLQTGVARRKAT